LWDGASDCDAGSHPLTPMDQPYRLDDLLRAAAARTPDKTAIDSDHGSLTFGALDTAADCVAAELSEQGVGLGDRVGIYLEKSLEAVVSLYGAMRAGAAYVPLDATAPAARTAYIATDCDIAALISTPPLIDGLRDVDPSAVPRGIACGSPCPDGFTDWNEVQSEERPAPPVQSVDSDLAYILYTSGSTGKPKGVAISHRSSLTFVRWAQQALELRESDVFSSHAPLHFDLSTLDFFGSAAAGGTVALVPPDAAMFPARLTEWISEKGITVWYSVPSALTLIVRYADLEPESLSRLRLVLFAGEVFPIRYLRELMPLAPEARFFNLYGPTETNVCTYHEVVEIPAADDPPLPIGRPCENTRCEVVDESGEVLTDVGAEGELVATGTIVAQGYWGDPEKTRERFQEHDSYRTGDIVQILESSPVPRYRFVGRRDHLVKSRGYRIELGEIEAALYSHPAVEECVAVAVPDEMVGNRIAAFCAVQDGTDSEDLDRACRERVPGYMVPERIVVVDSLPRTPNDKYDRPRLTEQAGRMIAQTDKD
jgi:amino acid adenylation domain-containing protein